MNPLSELFEWFPHCDFFVLDHGWLPHGRDYFFLAETSMQENPQQYRLQFTHIVEMTHITAVGDDMWKGAWDEEFTDIEAWQIAGGPEGYAWYTDHSLAWPGLKLIESSLKAKEWSSRLKKPMHEVKLETDRFRINLIFHTVRFARISNEEGSISRVVLPLSESGS